MDFQSIYAGIERPNGSAEGLFHPIPLIDSERTEQQPIEQGDPQRKAKVRRDPRIKYLGFTALQWPFLFALVGSWIFALAFFLGAKLVWHWVPALA